MHLFGSRTLLVYTRWNYTLTTHGMIPMVCASGLVASAPGRQAPVRVRSIPLTRQARLNSQEVIHSVTRSSTISPNLNALRPRIMCYPCSDSGSRWGSSPPLKVNVATRSLTAEANYDLGFRCPLFYHILCPTKTTLGFSPMSHPRRLSDLRSIVMMDLDIRLTYNCPG